MQSKMDHRRDTYIQKLGFVSLSLEGGYFKETYRSAETIQGLARDGGQRHCLSIIYYLIAPELGGKNYIHINKSNNTHFFHDGWPAKYTLVSPDGKLEEFILGPDIGRGQVPQFTAPGGYLKAAKILENETKYAKFPGEIPFTLISEAVSPGFDYRDRHVPTGKEVKAMHPELWSVLEEYIAPEQMFPDACSDASQELI